MGHQLDPHPTLPSDTPPSISSSRLFQPITVGRITPQHRIGMCPLTRYRATSAHEPTPLMETYYAQRASVPGTLLITEATFISPQQAGYADVPGLWSEAQVAGWQKVTAAVHARGSFIYAQLWALGRAAHEAVLAAKGFKVRGASAVAIGPERAMPVAMTEAEIAETVADYGRAAANAVAAGFDGVELHGANGYLIDQFLQDGTNVRTDGYGGSVVNRSRFAVEAVEACVAAIGPDRVGIRLSPWSRFQGMGMEDPVPQFSDVLTRLNGLGLAYVHLVEPRVSGVVDIVAPGTLEFAYDIWKGTMLIAGGFTSESARELVEEKHPEKAIVVMFGRLFIANPDLPFRIKEGLELNKYERGGFYAHNSAEGYTTYPFSEEWLKTAKI